MPLTRQQYADLEEYLARIPVSGLETILRLSEPKKFECIDIGTLCDMVEAELAFRDRKIKCGEEIGADSEKSD